MSRAFLSLAASMCFWVAPSGAMACPQATVGSSVTLSVDKYQVNAAACSPRDVAVRGDVLFFHGYGDTFTNHGKLFSELTASGLRVLAFDLPSHGKTTGRDLEATSFGDLQKMSAAVVRHFTEGPQRPLILMGWSTGGLIAARVAQGASEAGLANPAGLVLLAPAVSPQLCVGEGFCEITNRTLTHDESLWQRAISPRFPASRPGFAARMLWEGAQAWNVALPRELPTLVVLAGDDRYVRAGEVRKWTVKQTEVYGGRMDVLSCPRAHHELDNESPAFGGEIVRRAVVHFSASTVDLRLPPFESIRDGFSGPICSF